MTPEPRSTILVVDDERGPRESLRMILEPQHRVLLCAQGAEALEILRARPVDLVTLDLDMPGMKGEDLMRALRREFPQVEIVVITGCGSVESAAEGIRQGICDYLQKPFDVVQVSASVTRALARRRAREHLRGFLEELGRVVGRDRDARAILDDLATSQRLRSRLGRLLDASVRPDEVAGGRDATRTLELLEVLAETIETKDRFMRGHARRVAFYAELLAERVALSCAERVHVRIAAFLHDLGKVGVPTDLLRRPGPLAPVERSAVEQHPVLGARLVAPLDLPPAVALAVRHHHEWWDGGGYPDGLAGEEIPLAARIIGVVDAFDAMSCDRPYRRALPRETAIAELRRYAGVQFDPHLAGEFLALLECGVCDLDPALLADPASAAAAPFPGIPIRGNPSCPA